CRVALRPQSGEKPVIACQDASAPPELHASAARVVHDEDEGLAVLRQVAGSDVLAGGPEISGTPRAVLNNTAKTWGSTPGLHVGADGLRGGGTGGRTPPVCVDSSTVGRRRAA